jgi:DNA polymerase-3 subunit alpha
VIAIFPSTCRSAADVKGNDIVSQYSMNPLNDLGLLKMDFLGLKTLTVIEDTVTLIRRNVPGFSLKNIR